MPEGLGCSDLQRHVRTKLKQSLDDIIPLARRQLLLLWLESMNLDHYRQSIIEDDYDTMRGLILASEYRIVTMTDTVTMTTPDRNIFIPKWKELRKEWFSSKWKEKIGIPTDCYHEEVAGSCTVCSQDDR